MSTDFLRKLPLFSGLRDEDLDWLYDMAEQVDVKAGEYLMVEGTPGDAVYVILEGSCEVTKRSGDDNVILDGCHPGDVIGEIALLEQSPRTASVRATGDSRVLRIRQETFEHLLGSNPPAALAVLHTVMVRLRNTEAMLMQHEKMAGLGNMAAGLAHELNNPAAAVRRSTDQLGNALISWQRAALGLTTCGLDDDGWDKVEELVAQVRQRASVPLDLDPLARSDRESEMEEWLAGRGAGNAAELAPDLVGAGWNVSAVEELSAGFAPSQVPAVAQWLAAAGLVYSLLHELGISAAQISSIVRAVKNYSFLDQAPIQQVDVRDGLEDTLVILRHKLKGGVEVVRNYAPDLPCIEAYGSELNQVWTNIIDNAIDAMNGHGVLKLSTYLQDGSVVVEITDTGPGIPS